MRNVLAFDKNILLRICEKKLNHVVFSLIKVHVSFRNLETTSNIIFHNMYMTNTY